MPFHDEEIQQSNNNQTNTNNNKRIQYQIDDKKSVTESKDENLSDITSILFTAPKITEIKKFRFLVVDDSSMNRKMLCRLLECEGHTCVQAVDGLDAVEKIKDNIQENIIENIRGIMNNNLQKKIQKRSSRISKMNEMNRSIKSDYNGFNENREKTVENYEKISVSYSRSVSETLHRIGSNVNNNCRLSDVTNNYTNSTYNTNNTNNTSNSNNNNSLQTLVGLASGFANWTLFLLAAFAAYMAKSACSNKSAADSAEHSGYDAIPKLAVR